MDCTFSLLLSAVQSPHFYMVFWEFDNLRSGGYYVRYGFNLAIGRFSSGHPYTKVGNDGIVFTVYGHAFFWMAIGKGF